MAGYRWARLADVDYFHNPKILRLSNDARLLHLASIAFCCSQLTDGHIATISQPFVGHMANITPNWLPRRTGELEAAGLWIPNGDGWTLHDFDAMNPQAIRVIVERDRAANRERQARWKKLRSEGLMP